MSKLHLLVRAVAGLAIVGQPLVADFRLPWSASKPSVPVASIDGGRIVCRVCESDLGVPIRQMRPDDSANWRGIVRAENEGGPQNPGEFGCWDPITIRESTDEENIKHTRRIMYQVWGEMECRSKYHPEYIPDFSDQETARWAWLLETGRAGWRTIRYSYRHAQSAEDHHDINRGWKIGATLSAIGWTVRTYGGASTVAYLADAGRGGSDANSGLASNLPKLTFAAAKAIVQAQDPGYNAILVKRGSTFSGQAFSFVYFSGSWKGLSGSDATHRFEIGAYSTGARPIIDGASADSSVITTTRCRYASFYDLEITDSTYNGVDAITGIFGAEDAPISTDLIFENLVIHGVANGSYIRNDITDVQWRRCYFYDNFSCGEGSQNGGGMLDATTNLLLEECVFYRNGWNDTIEVLSQAVTADSGATVDVGSVPAAAVDDIYIGNKATITGGATPPSNGPFRVTAYTDATKRFTLSPTPNTSSTGSTLKLFGGVKGVFKHSVYAHYAWAQYEANGNIVVDGSDHGMGRRLGTLYHNICQGSAVPMLCNSGASHTGAAAGGWVHHNVLIGQQVNDTFKGGIGSYIVFSGEPIAGAGDNHLLFDENIVSGLHQTQAGLAVRLWEYNLSASAADGCQITNNVIYDSHCTGDGFGQGVSLYSTTGSGPWSLQNNLIWQLHDLDKLIDSNSATNTFTLSSGNTYAKTVNTGCFSTPSANPCTVAQWLAHTGETGETQSLAGAYSTVDEGRDLAAWDAATGGAGTTAAAMARITEYDNGTGEWSRYDHDATWIINYIRKGYGKAVIGYADLPHPMTVDGFTATLNGADMDTAWNDPGAPDNPTDIDHYSILKNGTEATTAAATATSKTVTGGGAGTYQIRVLDWNGVEYQLFDVANGPTGLTGTDGATTAGLNWVAPTPTGSDQSVLRQLEGAVDFVVIGTVAPGATSFTDTLNT